MEKLAASIHFHGDETVIYGNDDIKKALRSQIDVKGVKFEKGDVDGFVVRRGDIEMDFTIDFVVEEASREIEADVAKMLFEK